MASPQNGIPEPKAGQERRESRRYTVDCEAVVLSVNGSVQVRGKVSDLSLTGCLVVSDQRYTAGILVRVELQFQLQGIAFRAVGVVAGTRGARSFGVRFLDMPERRRQQLAEVLAEIADASASADDREVSAAMPSSDVLTVPVAGELPR